MSRIFHSFIVACLGLAVVKAGQEKNYEVVLNAISMDLTGKEVFGGNNVTMVMLEDNNAVISGTFTLLKDLPADATVYIEGFRAKGDGTGMYDTESSCDYETSLGDFFKNDTYVMEDMFTCSDVPNELPLPKGDYTLNDCVIGRKWPQDLPGNDWKMVAHAEMVDADNTKLKSTMEIEVTLEKNYRSQK